MVSVLCAVGSYALMSFVMTGAPLAMVGHGISTDDATLGIQWHVMAMFGPSFFTGNLIASFGKGAHRCNRLAILGALCCCWPDGCQSQPLYMGALVLLGIGWNFRLHRRDRHADRHLSP